MTRPGSCISALSPGPRSPRASRRSARALNPTSSTRVHHAPFSHQHFILGLYQSLYRFLFKKPRAKLGNQKLGLYPRLSHLAFEFVLV